jgi:hypothetical protein
VAPTATNSLALPPCSLCHPSCVRRLPPSSSAVVRPCARFASSPSAASSVIIGIMPSSCCLRSTSVLTPGCGWGARERALLSRP